jgi:hypothetical protein
LVGCTDTFTKTADFANVDVDPVDINIFGFKLPSVAVLPSKFRPLIICYRIILRMESCGTLTRLNGDILDGILTKL